jgi:amino acid permease
LASKTSYHTLSGARQHNDDGNKSRKTTVASQAALIAGTTIGGGFLALPAATAPCGALPSALGLIAVWIYLLGCSLSFANAIFLMKGSSILTKDIEKTTRNEDKDDCEISIFSLVRECFGNTAGFASGLLFLLLTKATLVAQLSKIGVILESNTVVFSGIQRGHWTILFSFIVTTTCLVVKQRNIERINDVLTSTMLLSFATLIALAGRTGWRIDGLKRSCFKSLFPSLGHARNTAPMTWVVPIFIQLLLHNEVVPLVSARLGDEKKVRRALIYGLFIPLLMCLIWSCVSLGIVPYEPPMGGGLAKYDPLSSLGERVLLKGSSGSIIGKLFLTSVNTMACSAICTTVFGSILATTQYLDDVITNSFGARRHATATNIFKHVFAIVPSSMIAVLGSSELFYHATAFAGEFPCTLLFGLIPPLCNLRLRWKKKEQRGEQEKAMQLKDVTVQIFLALVSVAIIAACRMSKV